MPVYKEKSTGRVLHNRMVTVTGISKQFNRLTYVAKKEDCEVLYKAGKYRYLYPLTPEMKVFCEKLRKPYPKRIADDSNLDQQGVVV
jgi:hypothetical protein